MLELNAAEPQADLIKDGSDQSFMSDVVEASREAAVIVDFHAEWCGPCKTLGPALEDAVKGAGGKAKLVKIDIDKNPSIAQQLRIQSIPAVYAFVNGQPVDGFMGAVSPSEAKAFVDRVAAQAPAGQSGGGLDEALEAAEQMLAQGAAADAAQTFAAVLGEDPENARAVAGLARAYAAAGQVDQAKATLDNAPAKIAQDPAVDAARASIELAEQAAEAGETGDLRARLEADPADHEARYDLAVALMAKGDNAAAVDELIELFRRDREWNDGAAKSQLFKLFDSLGPKDPVAVRGRRRLSSMIFA